MSGTRANNADPNVTPSTSPTQDSSADPAIKTIPTDEDIERDIKSALLAYVTQLAADLDNKKGFCEKYFQVKSSEKDTIDEKEDSNARQTFLSRDFEKFYEEIRTKLDALTKIDIRTMGREEESVALKEFRECFEKLNEAKFYNANGRPIVCWSGEKAQAKARELEKLSDSDIPSCSVISKLGLLLKEKSKLAELSKEQQQKYRDISDRIFQIGSALFADQQTGDAYLYFSASNEAEDKLTPFVRGNNHWEWELWVLRGKLEEGNKYYYVKYNQTEKRWEDPVDLTDMRKNPVDIMERRDSVNKDCPTPRKSVSSEFILERMNRARSGSKSPSRNSSANPSPVSTPRAAPSTPSTTASEPGATPSTPSTTASEPTRKFFQRTPNTSCTFLPPLDVENDTPSPRIKVDAAEEQPPEVSSNKVIDKPSSPKRGVS